MAVCLTTNFASGLRFTLYQTLPVWFRDNQLDLKTIAAFALQSIHIEIPLGTSVRPFPTSCRRQAEGVDFCHTDFVSCSFCALFAARP